jgi:GDPmannose 4,6-dehydratase
MLTALITGIGGQDGSYLAELLLQAEYRVVGMVRGLTSAAQPRIEHLRGSIELTEGNLLDQHSLENVIDRYRPTEIYNFAASHPASSQSFRDPVLTGEFNGIAVIRLLESVRAVDPTIRFCQASSAQIFGRACESPQSENTPFYPTNPYGIAKSYGHWITVNYREAHSIFACSSILFNHESPRRGEKFVTRKITRAVARIKAGLQNCLYLDDLEARRDWGYAADYVRAMWLMLQAPVADDYVLATGETHSVRDFCRIAFEYVGLDYEQYVTQEPGRRRATHTVELVGDAGKARRLLNWHPTLTFRELVKMMVESDLALVAREATDEM